MAVQHNADTNKWSGWLIDIYKLKKGIVDVSDEANKFFTKYQGKNLSNTITKVLDHNTFDSFIKQNKLADESLIAFLKDTDRGTKDLASYKQYLKDTGKQTTLFSDLTKKAGNIVKSFAATLGSMAVTKYTYSFYQMIYHPTF